ncbi:MAG: hypothetical protein HGA45_08435 [Chloroflexales bacterium]|nr:hypothetical protein [Chloroflexales bacterium]
MDARLHPEKVLGLAIGEAHVIRNAAHPGGHPDQWRHLRYDGRHGARGGARVGDIPGYELRDSLRQLMTPSRPGVTRGA